MYGLSNRENIFDLDRTLKVKDQGQTLKNGGKLFFQSTMDIHIQNPHKNSGWSLAGCIVSKTVRDREKVSMEVR